MDNRSPSELWGANINICDAKGRTPLRMTMRRGNAPAVKELVYLGADVSVVKADKNNDIRLERLKNEPEKMEQSLEFVYSEADVSVIKAVNYDAMRLDV